MSASSGLLLDLGILTRLRGSRPDPAIADFLARRRHQRMFISALSLCELPSVRDPDTGAEHGWVRELATRFAANILPVDHHVALACDPNDPLSPAILAATARHHHLTVVSTDAGAYAGLDVRVLDPLAQAEAPAGHRRPL